MVFVTVFSVFAGFLFAADGASVFTEHHAANNFIAGDISQSDLDSVLNAGLHAPSARNGQPWHFTVVQNLDLAKQIISNTVEGNVLIVVSAKGAKKNTGSTLDAGLAVESMYLAAQAIGLGSRIYTGPVYSTINAQMAAKLGIPKGYDAVAVVRIGQVDKSADAASGASPRQPLDAIVNYK